MNAPRTASIPNPFVRAASAAMVATATTTRASGVDTMAPAAEGPPRQAGQEPEQGQAGEGLAQRPGGTSGSRPRPRPSKTHPTTSVNIAVDRATWANERWAIRRSRSTALITGGDEMPEGDGHQQGEAGAGGIVADEARAARPSPGRTRRPWPGSGRRPAGRGASGPARGRPSGRARARRGRAGRPRRARRAPGARLTRPCRPGRPRPTAEASIRPATLGPSSTPAST